MSRSTYDERRKVADDLRLVALRRWCCHKDQFFDEICNCVMKPNGKYTCGAVLVCLAELIEPMYEPEPEWTAWVESLKNGDVVDSFAYDLIKHGGDMGPNGNTLNGIDEGVVLTNQLFDKFKVDFKKEIEADGKERK